LGIQAGLTITCTILTAKFRIFAGLCIWKIPKEEETEIRCEKLESGSIFFGKLKIIEPSKKETIEPSLKGKEVLVTIDNKTYKAIIV